MLLIMLAFVAVMIVSAAAFVFILMLIAVLEDYSNLLRGDYDEMD